MKHQRRIQKRLAGRRESVPESGMYFVGSGKTAFFRKPGSQNRKK